jgi:hypothetical protein
VVSLRGGIDGLSVVVPYKRFYFPPYSFVANIYFPEKN